MSIRTHNTQPKFPANNYSRILSGHSHSLRIGFVLWPYLIWYSAHCPGLPGCPCSGTSILLGVSAIHLLTILLLLQSVRLQLMALLCRNHWWLDPQSDWATHSSHAIHFTLYQLFLNQLENGFYMIEIKFFRVYVSSQSLPELFSLFIHAPHVLYPYVPFILF